MALRRRYNPSIDIAEFPATESLNDFLNFRQVAEQRSEVKVSLKVSKKETAPLTDDCNLLIVFGVPYGSRTRVAAVKGRCPRPLDERDAHGKVLEDYRKLLKLTYAFPQCQTPSLFAN